MTKYSAEDFANARFAEHPDGRTARRVEPERGTVFAWSMEHKGGEEDYCADEYLAAHGWVPVITARIIHDSDVEALCIDKASYERDDYLDGFIRGFQQAGGVILDDPEPTNAEKLEEIIGKIGGLPGWERQLLAEGLDKAGVKAPEANA